jgi:CRISPR system Cascade subunit CasA
MFFDRLWRRFEAQEQSREALKAEETSFAQALFSSAQEIFDAALPSVPCARLYRPRAEARARKRFFQGVRREFPELFPSPVIEETQDEIA